VNLKNKKWTEEEFLKVREEVLGHWSTGKEVENIYDGIEYTRNVPDHKNFAKVMAKAKKEGATLAQPRAGVALVEKHIELLNYLDKEGEADLLPTTIDSYTRQNNYHECEEGVKASRRAGRSLLNGFPGVNHGVNGCRKVLEAVNKPLESRHGTPDGRLLAEITMASGWTSNEGGGISYNIPYAKSVSIEKTVRDWQYCDRLVGFYEDNGVTINREPFGPLTGTLVPPSTSNSVAIVEALLAAEQGVKNITVGYGQCGNLIQDVAALRSLQEQTEFYLNKAGYHDVIVSTVFHQWMGGFPEDEPKAYALISTGAMAAALGKATKVIVKTPHEAVGVPTKEANAQGIKTTKMVLNLMKEQRYDVDSHEVNKEIRVIKAEVSCMIDKLYEIGKGDLAIGVIKGIEMGVIDIPFGPSKYNYGKMLPARANWGRSRYLEFGNIPLSDDLKAYNKERLEARAKEENREVSFQMTVDDIFAVSKGRLVGRPKGASCQFKQTF